ncbi:MAG: hypothetical protein WEG56_03615 [Chloroflexota bacterium]
MANRRIAAKDGVAAVAMLDSEKRVPATPAGGGTRRCIGSTKFGIEAHDAPATDFPVQPSQKDGLGRMCKTHWNQYTTALRKAALARKAAEACPFGGTTPDECSTIRERSVAGVSDSVPDCPVHGAFQEADPAGAPEPTRGKRRRKALVPEAGSQGDAG